MNTYDKSNEWYEQNGYTLITPELAQTWLYHNIQNRSIRVKFVNDLIEKIQNGKWQPITLDAIGFYEDGTLANGQHRLTAISKAGVPVYAKVEFNIPKDAAITIDAGKSRSAADNIKILTGKDYYTTRISNMISLCAEGSKNKSLTPEDHYKIAQMYEDDIVFVKDLFEGSPKFLQSASTMASVFLALENGVPRDKLREFVQLLNSYVARDDYQAVVINYRNKLFQEYSQKTGKQRKNYTYEIKRCQNVIYHFCNSSIITNFLSPNNYRYPLVSFNLS